MTVKIVENASTESVYQSIRDLLVEMEGEGLMPSIEENVRTELDLYEDSVVNIPRYQIRVFIRRLF